MDDMTHSPGNVLLFRLTGSLCRHAGSDQGPTPAGLTLPAGWHGGLSLSISAEISCYRSTGFALKFM